MKLRDKYRLMFSTPLGKEVLTDMLIRLHYFDEISTKPSWRRWFRDKNEEVVLQNFAKRLMGILGVYDGRNALAITQALLALPVRQEDEQ